MTPSPTYGNVVEYIADRLYLAAYTSSPTTSTPFPPQQIPDPYKQSISVSHDPRGLRSPKKRAAPQVTNTSGLKPVYFTVDDALLYNAFHHDFGPLHIGHLYRFAVTLHDILGDPKNERRVVVFWSKPNARARANAACLLACYMVLVQSWPPHLALSPLAQCEPPLMPFRDAGYSQADFILNVQDIVYGVWRAKEKELVNLREFVLDEYERYERVDMGDFNWISPNFVAFASPQFTLPPPDEPQPPIPRTRDELTRSTLPTPFKNVLEHFDERSVGLVVRLNSHLYPAEYFSALGITHIDMIFDDGTCPPLGLVRRFVNLAHSTIGAGKNIAVHCKAGLGRTGCLIGAYLVYRYGFSANEVIAFMRFMRPGMVVGPQQHWLHLNQDTFRQWWFEDTVVAAALEKQAREFQDAAGAAIRTPTKGSRRVTPSASNNNLLATPAPAHRRNILGEINDNESAAAAAAAAALPAPTPGQPRKSSHRSYSPARRAASPVPDENDCSASSVSASPVRRKRSTQKLSTLVDDDELATAVGNGMTEEEYMLRLHRRTSRSPSGRRAVSYTTTTTTTVSHTVTPPEKRSSGAGTLGATKVRSSPRRAAVTGGGVRKVSGQRSVSGGSVAKPPPPGPMPSPKS